MTDPVRLKSIEVAQFVARGFLRLDAVVPDALNRDFLEAAGAFAAPEAGVGVGRVYRRGIAESAIPEVPAGLALSDAYAPGTPVARLLDVPRVRGAIESLVGEAPIFDHHFLHVTFPPEFHAAGGGENVSQVTHQDSTIDPRSGFDIQIMYYPHAVTRAMGGTRFVPGTHFRKVSEAAIGRYQNMLGQEQMVCEAGTVLVLHHGIWHGAGVNHDVAPRYMFKIRIRPSGRQSRGWDLADLPPAGRRRGIFFRKSHGGGNGPSIEDVLTTPEPWFENDTGRLEYVNRIRLWRRLIDDETYDADYWVGRLETPESAFPAD